MERWSMTCCSAGSWGWAWTIRPGTRPLSARKLAGDVARKFLAAIVAHPKERLLSTEHFSVDGR